MGTWGPHVVFVIIAIVIQSCIVYSQRATKSSLTFVIDDSGSMTDEIEQVKDSIDSIFDTVMSSNQSHIKNFVLVTFNDPDYILHAVTEDRTTFTAAAARVHVRDGVSKCPERAMLGIKIGIENSLPMSTLYVFTDASAKDYGMYDEIKAMAQRKQTQVTFLLSGDCGSRDDQDYQVYHQLAQVTNGEVFNLKKKDIKDILKYVKENTKSRGNFIASKSFPPGYGFKFNFTVDSRTKEFTMSIAGLNPKLEITDPNGHLANTEPIVEKDEILIVKVTNTTPGLYKASVGSNTGTLAKVTGPSDIHFEYGFSKLEPTSLSVTATRPEADGKSYLSIQLYGDGVTFKTAKIFDLNDILLKELPLRLLDNKTNFYVTEQFEPPKTTFRIFVSGYDDVNKMGLNQSAGSLTGPRDPKESVPDVAPEVTIIEGNKVILDYNSALRVTCKVHAHPPPEITWRDIDTGEIIRTSVTEVAPPYDFISTLNIEKSNRNGTYNCTAKNSLGKKDSQLVVETNIYFNVLETPKNTTRIEFDKEGSVSCVVNASPPVTTIWYKDGRPLSNDTNVVIASGNTTLTIKRMDLELVGTYICEVRNELQRQVFHSEVETFGLAAPIIEVPEETAIEKNVGEYLILWCRADGYPIPNITWTYYNVSGFKENKLLKYDKTSMVLDNLQVKDSGYYRCEARNDAGLSHLMYSVIVNAPPVIVDVYPEKTIKTVKGDSVLRVPCDVTGSPKPTVTWIKDGSNVDLGTSKYDTDNGTLLIMIIDKKSAGNYVCVAENKVGKAIVSYDVIVTDYPELDSPVSTKFIEKGQNVNIACDVPHNKFDLVRWYKDYNLINNGELTLNNPQPSDNGVYSCRVSNSTKSSSAHVNLTVGYKPYFTSEEKLCHEFVKCGMICKRHSLDLRCSAKGSPIPKVSWWLNGENLNETNMSYKLIMRLDNRGNYTCEISNELGSIQRSFTIAAKANPIIEVPEETTIEKSVREYLILWCRADGYPIPNITWTYYNDSGIKENKLLKYDKTSMVLDNLQVKDSGYYLCEARNDAGLSHLMYRVIVIAPPVIVDVYPDKTIKTVKGDSVLRVPCDVTGSPKPTVTWIKDGSNVDLGTSKYDTDNGTLLIMIIDKKSAGNYVCVAENKVGKAIVSYDVIVTDYPELDSPVSTKFIEKGQNVNIACDIPHNRFDLVRWYKDYNLINNGELTLNNPQPSDNGVYSCRVSNSTKSSSAHVSLTVGYKPYFTSEEKLYHEFVKDDSLDLRCSAKGSPIPKVSWWLNGENLDETNMSYELIMRLDNRGNYTCEISNELGSIQRSFTVAAKGCILDAKKDFLDKKQPLMLSSSRMWPMFDVTKGYMFLNKDDIFNLHCPRGFDNFHTQFIEARCESETNVKVNGKVYKYAEIKCKAEVEPTAQIFREGCLAGHNTTYIQVGYNADGRFFKVYDVCLDNEDEVPLYTQHIINRAQYGVTKNLNQWFGHIALPLDFDTIYDCVTQVEDISTALRKPFHQYDKCCYNKRQLVDSKDLRPGIPPAVVYSYLNVVPHWSTCNSKNWAVVEHKVRDLALRNNELIITTGTAKPSRISSSVHSSDIMLHDKRGRTQPIAQYLWKVVQDPVSKGSLAIIQINVPDISIAGARKYVHCRDICGRVGWMDSSNWHNVADGYTFCCSILEFESMFHYNGQFNNNMTSILTDYRSDYDYS